MSKNGVWCGRSTIRRVDGVLTMTIKEWPKGILGRLFRCRQWTISINKIEEFADSEPKKFADLAQNFWVSDANSQLPGRPLPSRDWREFANRVLEVAQARNVQVGGFLNC